MPIHDWTLVDAGTFHAFHLAWLGQLQAELNGGLLPSGYYAMAEQHAGDSIPDMLTLHTSPAEKGYDLPSGGTTTATKTRPRVQRQLSARVTPKQGRRTMAIRHVSGHRIVALIEIASPANKDRHRSVTDFANKVTAALQLGIHVSMADLFPPGKFDPAGLHGALWERFDPDCSYELPAEQPLTLVAYAAANTVKAYVDHLAVRDPLPKMPLFLAPHQYIDVPMESSYLAAFGGMPKIWRDVLEGTRSVLGQDRPLIR